MSHRVLVFLSASLICMTAMATDTFGTRQRPPKPHEYGNVEINNFSKKADMAPVVFSHWLHRSRYTCRLCHVDLGFMMEAGQTYIREEDNRNGLYCGACHNGKEAFTVEESGDHCDRCHSVGKDIEPETNFYQFVKGFPRARFGNRIDWLKAEEQGLFELTDFLEGVSLKHGEFEAPDKIELDATVEQMPDIIFSHEKHAIWNGCELCHPQIFGIKKGVTQFDMQEIFDGKYCGACHGKVAFTSSDCQLCHSKNVY